jgi:hypothetical protein
MLNHFNLNVIDKIFRLEPKGKLSSQSKMLYINCITHHFKNIEPYIGNLGEFTILMSAIPNFKTFYPLFSELSDATLIIITNDSIQFKNIWSKYMNLSALSNSETRVNANNFANAFTDEMYNSHQLVELCAMKNKISKMQVNKLMQLFFAEQTAIQTKYGNESECRKHFIYWIANNLDKVSNENVKSTAKILGR